MRRRSYPLSASRKRLTALAMGRTKDSFTGRLDARMMERASGNASFAKERPASQGEVE